MVDIWEMPEEESDILYPVRYSIILPEGNMNITGINFIKRTWLYSHCNFGHADESFVHLSKSPCNEANFATTPVLTVNSKTGAWLIRLPYNDPYP